MSGAHQPVMLQEACDLLLTNPNGVYIDATFGRGGHSMEILSRLGKDAKLIAFDKDPEAIKFANEAIDDSRFVIFHDSFKNMRQVLSSNYGDLTVDGVLMDLGVSSPQLDSETRGFSYRYNAPLDMRMNSLEGVSVADWLDTASEQTIADVLFNYGDERHSRVLAKAIVEYRKVNGKILDTFTLVSIINLAVSRFYQRDKNPATRTFQALRIQINSELSDLQEGLLASKELLSIKGRLVVISFHSIEHRIVRKFMQQYLPGNKDISCELVNLEPEFKKIGKVVTASQQELLSNSRSKSAQLRAVEKIVC
jgi:16S rRNA (cytosine1402-N4)-methyltransferase